MKSPDTRRNVKIDDEILTDAIERINDEIQKHYHLDIEHWEVEKGETKKYSQDKRYLDALGREVIGEYEVKSTKGTFEACLSDSKSAIFCPFCDANIYSKRKVNTVAIFDAKKVQKNIKLRRKYLFDSHIFAFFSFIVILFILLILDLFGSELINIPIALLISIVPFFCWRSLKLSRLNNYDYLVEHVSDDSDCGILVKYLSDVELPQKERNQITIRHSFFRSGIPCKVRVPIKTIIQKHFSNRLKVNTYISKTVTDDS